MRGKSLSDFKKDVVRTENSTLGLYKYYIDPALRDANKIFKSREAEVDRPKGLELDNDDQK